MYLICVSVLSFVVGLWGFVLGDELANFFGRESLGSLLYSLVDITNSIH